jgi:tetratricopeptide (TPR) repeat protein
MKPKTTKSSNPEFDRRTVLTLIKNALHVDAFRFGEKLAERWLARFPGDLAVEYLLAQSLIKQEKFEDTNSILKKIVYTDPEFLPAQRILAYSSSFSKYKFVATAQQCILALGGNIPDPDPSLNWSAPLKEALAAQKDEKHDEAEALYREAVSQQPDSPLPAVLHLKFSAETNNINEILNLAESYTNRWPDTIACTLIYADALNGSGKGEMAVNLLHHAVSLDIGGQVAVRLWGPNHAYRDLWPTDTRLVVDLPIVAEVAASMNWNQLPQGELRSTIAHEKILLKTRATKEDAISKAVSDSARQELKELAIKIKKPVLGHADGRYPVYVMITTRKGLENQYGAENLAEITKTITSLENKTKLLSGWNAISLFVDDPMSTDKFGLPPAIAGDPWSIKKLIGDLSSQLAEKGEKIGALLIIGGDKVVPFHLLPNPLDDFDTHVPSDNPYACNDENYFVPQWPIGRLPGSSGKNPTALLTQMNKVSQSRPEQLLPIKRSPWWQQIILNIVRKFLGRNDVTSLGISAEVWRRASHAVYRSIGKPHHLKVSPPVDAAQISNIHKKSTQLAYYNLHGLQDTAEWYGQRDPMEGQRGPDYPVAVRPQDIKNSGRAPKIVFSEACFGANIIDKLVEEAICLKFLDSGSLAVVGSTCTSYGSITMPLIAADLLGKAFWNFLKQGYPAGESLRRAKIHLAREMNKRQGYLDGEDQKTLISFILYGDPLAINNPDSKLVQEKSAFSPPYNSSRIRTVCDRVDPGKASEIPVEVIKQVKGIVRNYLPGMEDADLQFSEEHTNCKGHECHLPNRLNSTNAKHGPSRKVVTLSKQIEHQTGVHTQHARITFSAEGKVTKLAVSR